MTKLFRHETVLLEESVAALAIRPSGIYVDCTLGGAGHSQHILEQLDENGHLYAFDQDETAIQYAKEKLSVYAERRQVTFIKANFRQLASELNLLGVTGVDGILYDLGVSSPQLDQGERGFSYHQDAILDMRMDQTASLTAEQVINTYSYHELATIFYRYGEEKFSRQIARAIEKRRLVQPIRTTSDLVEIIKEAIPAPARRKGGHPAKRVFQAVRIAVNDELKAVEESLEQAIGLLNPDGRVAAITFHSLEDRIVKTTFKKYSTPPEAPAGIPMLPDEYQPILKLVTRKPILPTTEELERNNRARSAKLRIAQKVPKAEKGRHKWQH